MDLKGYAIVSDFDGTITLEDSNDLLFQMYGNEVNVKIEDDFKAGILGTCPAMIMHFENLNLTMEKYYDFLKQHINIDLGFDPLLQWVHKQNIPFFIVSAGFRQGIEYILGQERLNGVQVFANDLHVNDESKLIYPVFAEEPDCETSYGPCGNCKRACVKAIRQQTQRNVIFLGDGLTDRCAYLEADLTFAKADSALEQYCSTQAGLPYTLFNGYEDILTHLQNLIN